MNIHASCVSLRNKGVLLLGPSGSGKSDLALRLISLFGGILVADDRVDILLSHNDIIASAPKSIKGLLEVRGIGIIKLKSKSSVKIDLVIELVSNPLERMPEEEKYNLCGKDIPFYRINPFEISAPSKIMAALRLL